MTGLGFASKGHRAIGFQGPQLVAAAGRYTRRRSKPKSPEISEP